MLQTKHKLYWYYILQTQRNRKWKHDDLDPKFQTSLYCGADIATAASMLIIFGLSCLVIPNCTLEDVSESL